MKDMINNVNNEVKENAVNNVEELETVLPTSEEYKEIARKGLMQVIGEFSQPKYQCPKCGSGMYKDQTIVLNTVPAQYVYNCEDCGYTENQFA